MPMAYSEPVALSWDCWARVDHQMQSGDGADGDDYGSGGENDDGYHHDLQVEVRLT